MTQNNYKTVFNNKILKICDKSLPIYHYYVNYVDVLKKRDNVDKKTLEYNKANSITYASNKMGKVSMREIASAIQILAKASFKNEDSEYTKAKKTEKVLEDSKVILSENDIDISMLSMKDLSIFHFMLVPNNTIVTCYNCGNDYGIEETEAYDPLTDRSSPSSVEVGYGYFPDGMRICVDCIEGEL